MIEAAMSNQIRYSTAELAFICEAISLLKIDLSKWPAPCNPQKRP
jgi:hypothetical protein